MDVLFSTPLGLYRTGFSGAPPLALSGSDTEYYGITSVDGKITLSHSGIDNACLRPEDYQKRPRGWLSLMGRRLEGSADTLLQPHQIEACGSQVICANTGRNGLLILDSITGQNRRVYPTRHRFDIEINGRKHNHFNSVHRRGDELYAVAFNHDQLSALWIWKWPEMELEDVVATKAEWAHNIWLRDDDIVLCGSKQGALYSVRDKANIWTCPKEHFLTRGLAANQDYVVVGLSANTPRTERKTADAGLAVLDRATMQTLDIRIFTGIGVVHEVRLLGEPDDCHGGGIIDAVDALPFESDQNSGCDGDNASVA